MRLLSGGILKELAGVKGRYIEWEWDPRTLTSDYIAMRESCGVQVEITNAGGQVHYLQVPLRALEDLIERQLVCEDRSKRASGFRLYRLTAEGLKHGGPEC